MPERTIHAEFHRADEADSPAAWLRLAAAVAIGTIGARTSGGCAAAFGPRPAAAQAIGRQVGAP